MSAILVLKTTESSVKSLVIFLAGLLLISCASVKNFDENDSEIGFEHYAAKYYLVIEPQKDGAKQVKILTLPDLTKPRYMKHKPGWGSVQFEFKIANGVLTEFGSTQDSKAPETLATVGTLGTAWGAVLAAKVTASAAAGAKGGAPTQTITLKSLVDVAANLTTNVVKKLAGQTDTTLLSVRTAVQAEVAKLRSASDLDATKEIVSEIQEAQKTTRKIVTRLETQERILKTYLDGLNDPLLRSITTIVYSNLAVEITKLKKFALSGVQPTIYEIKPLPPGGIEFRKVDLG